MAATTYNPEAVLVSLSRVVHPDYGIDIVNLGTIYGIELDGSVVTITMALANENPDSVAELQGRIADTLKRRHGEISDVQFEISNDPPWREDFITPEGQLQQMNPLPVNPSSEVTPEDVMDTLMFVIDPEVGVNIVDLGLVYNIDIEGERVIITMTLTTPGCPLHDTIEEAAHRVIETRHPMIEDIVVNLVWDPPWSTDMISDSGRRQLGWA